MKDGFDSVKVIDCVSGDVSVHARVSGTHEGESFQWEC